MENTFKYITSQPAYADLEGHGIVRYYRAGDVVVRESPAPAEKAHILTPINGLAQESVDGVVTGSAGKIDIMNTDIHVLRSLAEAEELDLKEVKKQLKAKGVTVRTNDADTIIRKVQELRLGQPTKKVRVGIDDTIV